MKEVFVMDRFLVNYLKNIVPVTFNLETAEEFLTIGKNIPKFTVRINNPLRKKDLMTSTSLSLAEAYMRRDIEVDEDLYEVLNSFISSIDSFKTNRTLLHHLLSTSRSEINQKKEVTSHYDIGNEFYRLWLDETMSYSCGYFKEDDDDLYTAQLNKVELTLSKLHLEKGMRLLDVGCGWGFLLVHAAKKYGIHGTGITLSEEQYKKFSETIKQEGLSELLEVRLMDYRELANSGMKFDRVVSIGMIEHVGRGNYELFLDNIKAVLQPSGVFLLHFISSLQEHSGDPFIKKYIFPGGVIPSLREILSVMGNKQL